MTLEGKEEESNIPKYQAIQAAGIPSAFGVIKERLNYPYTAMAHVTFNSRQFSNLPKRSYECYGLKSQNTYKLYSARKIRTYY